MAHVLLREAFFEEFGGGSESVVILILEQKEKFV